ncbi:MAG: AI-2E family transporter [Candidatus Saccharimonas sp.]
MRAQLVPQQKLWNITLIIALIVAVIFLLPQLSVLILACLMAYVFHPLYKKLKRKSGWTAATSTLVLSLLAVVIPIIVVLAITAGQLLQFSESLSQSGAQGGLSVFLQDISHNINAILSPLSSLGVSIDYDGVVDFLQSSLPEVARAVGGFALGIVGSVPTLAIAFIIYSFVFVELLVRGDRYIKGVYAISPFDHHVTEKYLERTGLMANAMVKGQLMISMIISAIAALLLIPLGYGHLVFLLFILFTILNFIPLGCGIVFIPITIYSALTDQFWPAVIVLALYCIAANIDSVLRPIFIPKKIQLSTALTMVSTFCGIAYFGILGVVYGPIIMILIVTALSLYGEQRQPTQTAHALK